MKGKKIRVVDLVTDLFEKGKLDLEVVYELVDVEFIKEGKHRYLRVYIDKEGGVSLEDCKLVSQALNVHLDEKDPIEEEYILEVSSPGIERPLKKDADFIRFSGKLVQLKLYYPLNGVKIIEGILQGLNGSDVVIDDEHTGTVITIPRDKIATAKLLFRFS